MACGAPRRFGSVEKLYCVFAMRNMISFLDRFAAVQEDQYLG